MCVCVFECVVRQSFRHNLVASIASHALFECRVRCAFVAKYPQHYIVLPPNMCMYIYEVVALETKLVYNTIHPPLRPVKNITRIASSRPGSADVAHGWLPSQRTDARIRLAARLTDCPSGWERVCSMLTRAARR